MDTPRELSTHDVILLRTGAQDTHAWQRTLEQIEEPEAALAEIQNPTPFDWEAEDVF